MKQIIATENAPSAIGAYSQAVKVSNLVFLSGQIAINPLSNILENHSIEAEIEQVIKNLQSVCKAAGGHLHNIVKLNVYLIDLKNHYGIVNEFMEQYFDKPYPARAVVQVSALPKGASIEIDAMMQID